MNNQPLPYEVEDSAENALAMLGSGYEQPSVVIDPPRKSVVRRKGKMVEEDEPAWVKFSTGFKKELAELGEYSLKVFLYIGLSIGFESGSSHPGIRKIAKETGMAQNTVIKAVKELEEKGFLEVERREKSSNVYMPIRYISVGKTASPDEADVDEAHDNLPHEDAKLPHQNDNLPHDSTVKLHNQIEQDKEEIIQEANQTVDMILKLNLPNAFQWKGRDSFRDNHLKYADWYNKKTGQECGKKSQRSWQKAFSEWQDEELDIPHLQEAYEQDVAWKKVIADPNELTKKAVAIKAKSKMVLAQIEQRPTGSSSGYYA